jgi:hypothetical protein
VRQETDPELFMQVWLSVRLESRLESLTYMTVDP